MTDQEREESEAKLMREMAYVVRKAEMTEITGTQAPWEERDDEPLTLSDFRRLPAGSDERELILCHLLLDLWNEVDHLRTHVCPHAEDELEDE